MKDPFVEDGSYHNMCSIKKLRILLGVFGGSFVEDGSYHNNLWSIILGYVIHMYIYICTYSCMTYKIYVHRYVYIYI